MQVAGISGVNQILEKDEELSKYVNEQQLEFPQDIAENKMFLDDLTEVQASELVRIISKHI